MQSRALWEVGEDANVVVGEVDALLVACGAEVLNGRNLVACGEAGDNVSTGSSLRCKCSDLSLSGNRLGVGHTSEVELALFEWVQVGERVVDQLCREPHGGGAILCYFGESEWTVCA